MIFDVRTRTFPGARPGALGELLDSLGQPDDRLWPTATGRWAPMRLDGPLADLPSGGHGLVRYSTVDHEPGRRVEFRFDPTIGLRGVHRFEIVDDVELRHTIEASAHGTMRLAWPLAVLPLHAATLADLFDTAGRALGEAVPERRHSWWVRFLLAVGPSPEREEAAAAKRSRRDRGVSPG